MIQSLPQANHIYQTFQADFDRALCNALEKYHSCSGFALLLRSIIQYANFKHPFFKFPLGPLAALYLLHQEGNGVYGNILDDMGFSTPTTIPGEFGTQEFFDYFIKFLENPERSGIQAFDQHRYATASKECLQMCLCSHQKFSKGVTEPACHHKILLRNKPWAWKAQSSAKR